ncbi:MAG: hypothetical protein P8Y67_13440, partial [Alphaproteobacteria bacterium]
MPISQKFANSRAAMKKSGQRSTQATVEEIRRSAEVFLRAFQSARQLQVQGSANNMRQNGAGKQVSRSAKAGSYEPREEIAREIIGKLQSYINALHKSVAKSAAAKSGSALNGARRAKSVAAKSSAAQSKSAAQNSQASASKAASVKVAKPASKAASVKVAKPASKAASAKVAKPASKAASVKATKPAS